MQLAGPCLGLFGRGFHDPKCRDLGAQPSDADEGLMLQIVKCKYFECYILWSTHYKIHRIFIVGKVNHSFDVSIKVALSMFMIMHKQTQKPKTTAEQPKTTAERPS